MEEVVDNVVKKFEEAERTVQKIEDQLDANFSEKLGSEGADKISLMQALEEVKQSHAEIRNEARELGNLQREMALAFQKNLLQTVQQLQALTENNTAGKSSDEATKAAIDSLKEQSNLADVLTQKLKNSTNT
uniref:Uncharacterized protein LOC100178853 n=1 Tax=Phallusia mammillata TaxID=59560 RepID=A0A6F9DHN1_9ASCI|nr:uncharacterized protein LOC100178853 [Phallusia mammillata]